MSDHPVRSERFDELLSRLVDGELAPDELAELEQFLRADPQRHDAVVNQLLLDSLLQEEVGTDAVTSLVDVVTESGAMPVVPGVAASSARIAPAKSGQSLRHSVTRWRRAAAWISAAALLAVVAFLVGRYESTALASPATIVRAAAETHAEAIERVYLVEVDRSAQSPEVAAPRDVRVMTQGDRFYVQMNRGQRQWYWGRNASGAIWLTVGPRRAIVVEQDELGVPLEYISNLYSLNLESLLDNFLKHCNLSRADESETTHVITATPRYRWRGGWVRSARIEVDRETKVVRRLMIERELPQQGSSTVTFTLVTSRPPDESKYRPEGHLTEPFRLLTRDTQPDNRRELMTNWFGPAAERWIKNSETKPQ